MACYRETGEYVACDHPNITAHGTAAADPAIGEDA
jgi:hypothetical protein